MTSFALVREKMHCSIDIRDWILENLATLLVQNKFWENVIEVFGYFCTINFIAHI